ncbi:chlorophyllase-1 [Phtheirospermum japonicum]|uniref:Chlorophyllase-1 n=1 Tax=Phtheirospermum japonicum TaxID=374723 RepID=A0A830DFG8_9LAMI|nr:chlorophyllase-1 [Phtheirospermum japonicum]
MAQIDEHEKSMSKISVFEPGSVRVKTIKVKKCDAASPPAELLILAPEAEGNYPVLLFCHAYCTNNTWYSHILQHVSSHGYIVVAPQFYHYLVISLNDEIKTAAKVINWLPQGLTLSLPKKVQPNLSKLALMGHSRGGKTAFALVLGYEPTSLKFKALLGLDPVAMPSPPAWVEPSILLYVPRSFNLSIPIGIVGTGLSNQKSGCIIPPLAPDGFNHSEFFNESKPPCCYFRAKDYGHCDVLNESKLGLASLVCRSGKGSKEKMRRGIGGVVVAFLKAYLEGEFEDLEGVVCGKDIAPIALDPVIHIKE